MRVGAKPANPKIALRHGHCTPSHGIVCITLQKASHNDGLRLLLLLLWTHFFATLLLTP